MEKWINLMKFEAINSPIQVKWKPKENDLKDCMNLGVLLSNKAIELSNNN